MTPAERELLLAMADKAVSPPDRVGFKWAAISNLAAQVRTEAKATQAAEALLSEPVGKGSVCEMCGCRGPHLLSCVSGGINDCHGTGRKEPK